MHRRTFLAVAGSGIPASLLLEGCTTGQLTAAVDAIYVTADAALIALSTAGVIPAPIATIVSNYLSAVGQAITDTSTELASADTAVVKAAKITQIWATAILPNLTQLGAPATIIALVNAVDAAVQALLKQLAPSTVFALAPATAAKVDKYKLTAADKRKLGSLKNQGQSIKQRAAALK